MEEGGRIRKLRWMCRRGMKELDVLLAGFLDRHERELQDGKWPELERLLSTEDDRLWQYILNPDDAPEPDLEPLIRAIHGSLQSGH